MFRTLAVLGNGALLFFGLLGLRAEIEELGHHASDNLLILSFLVVMTSGMSLVALLIGSLRKRTPKVTIVFATLPWVLTVALVGYSLATARTGQTALTGVLVYTTVPFALMLLTFWAANKTTVRREFNGMTYQMARNSDGS